MPKVKCEICGCEFMAKYRSKRFCDKCHAEKDRKYKSEYRQQWKSVGKETRKKPEKKTEKPVLSIAEIAKRASAAGKTYGQYVAEMGL